MKRILLSSIALMLLCSAPSLFALARRTEQPMPSMPSTEEVNDLLSKANEYVGQYQLTFTNAKPTLDRSPAPGFSEKSDQLCSQATALIAAIKKNGPTAYALVGLIVVLDDMSLNAAKASGMAMIVGLEQMSSDQKDHAMQDIQDLAQAGKNCDDISELIVHSTLRLIAVEEKLLRSVSEQQK